MIKNHRGTGALEKPFDGPCKPDTLIFSPTRELCIQIYDDACRFCHRTPYRIVRIYGQEKVSSQIEQIAKGADVVVATPGRCWDFVDSGILEVTEVNCLVIDEADRMISQGMEEWIRDVVERHGMPTKEVRQTMMFSATFPESIQKLAADYLYEHLWVRVGVVGGAVRTVTQKLERVQIDDKFERLMTILADFLETRQPGERLLVFTNTKLQAKGLDELLYDRHFDTGALHGGMSQQAREEHLRRFREGEIDILVATDVASRGLDIEGVSHVLNYDLPNEIDVYVQRIGRTGRIGHRGTATTFIAVDRDGILCDNDVVLQELPRVMKDAHSEVPEWLQQHVDKEVLWPEWRSISHAEEKEREQDSSLARL